ncbi:hypothetical protein EJ03DRAFT_206042 [Teratosphaeria nubilosa]|uniref:Uncharacterized protein n=1 Tax=Teratosphaeria nubilosa TaxID=161662 RepID=A0A6G1KYY7_9PEZI|nr:hypothetical protein EJ03DRAFT_206042 [Teratosphaeria nubilosa]
MQRRERVMPEAIMLGTDDRTLTHPLSYRSDSGSRLGGQQRTILQDLWTKETLRLGSKKEEDSTDSGSHVSNIQPTTLLPPTHHSRSKKVHFKADPSSAFCPSSISRPCHSSHTSSSSSTLSS